VNIIMKKKWGSMKLLNLGWNVFHLEYDFNKRWMTMNTISLTHTHTNKNKMPLLYFTSKNFLAEKCKKKLQHFISSMIYMRFRKNRKNTTAKNT
jgi:hypothetical protein